MTNQSLIYEFNTGSIKELKKDEFVSLMISAGLTNKSKSDLVNYNQGNHKCLKEKQ